MDIQSQDLHLIRNRTSPIECHRRAEDVDGNDVRCTIILYFAVLKSSRRREKEKKNGQTHAELHAGAELRASCRSGKSNELEQRHGKTNRANEKLRQWQAENQATWLSIQKDRSNECSRFLSARLDSMIRWSLLLEFTARISGLCRSGDATAAAAAAAPADGRRRGDGSILNKRETEESQTRRKSIRLD